MDHDRYVACNFYKALHPKKKKKIHGNVLHGKAHRVDFG